MSIDHILSTKLVIPANPSQLVARTRLLQMEGSPRIVLVCAPAGYGKTTLIASWAEKHDASIAWLSLDSGDNDPVRFLVHFVTAIQTRFPDFGQVVVEMLESSPPPPVPGLMRLLVNQMCDLRGNLCIILDDLHTVSEPVVHEAIAFLVDHQPSLLQLVFASRSDPPFSLARIRGQRQLMEYRASDLRFTLEEAESFCNEVMKFELPHSQVEALANRTEGWIVGLQLAAVSLRSTADKASFINSFAGDNRHITDFLLDEVLRSCSQEMQNFLLHTSLLERFSASLCDAVTGRTDSREMIDQMERNNMFILGLDHHRTWYRYHHLFTSLLQSRLRTTQREMIKVLHRRASQWFSENDLITEAVNNAIAAADFEFAADLMELHGRKLFSHGQINSALAWVQQLPASLMENRPVLSMTCAWGSFYMDNLIALERHISTVEKCLSGFHDAPFGSKERTMLGQVALMRGCQAAYSGKIEEAITRFTEALSAFTPGRTLYRAAAVCLGVNYTVYGKLESAYPLLTENIEVSEAKQNILVPITAVFGLARLQLLRGRPLAAKLVYDKVMRDCFDAGWQGFPACGILHLGLGELAYEMNDLAGAEQHLTRGMEMTAAGMQYVNTWGRVLLAQTRLARGNKIGLLDPKTEASLQKYAGRFVADVPPLSAAIARFWLAQGRIDAVLQWVEAAQLPVEGPLAAGRESEYLVLARFLIISEKTTQALELLARLRPPAAQGKRLAVEIEICVLETLALQAQGKIAEALDSLKQALRLAENTGLLRVFIGDGALLSSLLKKIARGADYTSYAHYLLGYIVTETTGNAEMNSPLPLLFSKKWDPLESTCRHASLSIL